MADTTTTLADGFVRAILEDNSRLREALSIAEQSLVIERGAKEALKRDTMRDIFMLVDKLGGDVTLEREGNYDPQRLVAEARDYDFRTRYRILPDTAATE